MANLKQEWIDTLIHLGADPTLAKVAVDVLATPSGLAPDPMAQSAINAVWQKILAREV